MRYINQKKVEKTCSQQSMTYGFFKNFLRETVSDITLSDKPFDTVENPKYDMDINEGLVQWLDNFFIKTLLLRKNRN